jgi:predicted KAP-like P-loop ATPase
MASRQRLKKEIDYVVSDLILDCFTFINMRAKTENEDVLQIVQESLNLREDLINQVNHPESKDASQTVKSYFDNIAKVLIDTVEESYVKLGKLINPDV